MSYTKTTWVNGTTPINATNMNKIEDQLETNTNDISTNATNILNMQPVSLYDNSSGTTTTANLSDSIANYKYLLIEWEAKQYATFWGKETTIISNPTASSYSKSSCFWNATNSQAYVCNTRYTLTTNSITIDSNQAGTIGATTAYGANNNCWAITKVVGYK